MQSLHVMSGASAGALGCADGALLRDSSLLANHAFLNYEAHLRLLGGHLLGAESETIFL